MTLLLAIDPGNEVSGWVLMGDAPKEILAKGIEDNRDVLNRVRLHRGVLAIEKVEAFGMAVGKEVFETVFWSGRFAQIYYDQSIYFEHPQDVIRVGRKAIKIHCCGTTTAKDPNIRQAMLDLFGPKGTKASPGPTYGFSKDKWAALALAATVRELR